MEKRLAGSGLSHFDADTLREASAWASPTFASGSSWASPRPRCAPTARPRASCPSTSAWTPAPLSSSRTRPYLYSTYERECEADPTDRKKVVILGSGPQPHRPGHRVRLLLLPRLVRLQGAGLRDDHGELQPETGLHRLRHLRSPLLRAARLRGRDERAREGEARGGGDPVRRADSAPPRGPAPEGGRAHPRHEPRRGGPGRGPQAVQRPPQRPQDPAARKRHRDFPRRSQGRGRPHRLPRAGAGRPTCWVDGPWPSCSTRAISRGS
jgi:hypothetical protein